MTAIRWSRNFCNLDRGVVLRGPRRAPVTAWAGFHDAMQDEGGAMDEPVIVHARIAVAPPSPTCLQCGKVHGRGRQASFCSGACCQRWHHDRLPRPARAPRPCVVCGTPHLLRGRCCGRTCADAARAARQVEQERAASNDGVAALDRLWPTLQPGESRYLCHPLDTVSAWIVQRGVHARVDLDIGCALLTRLS